MKKLTQAIISLFLCTAMYISCFPTNAGAIADHRYTPVTIVKQAKTNWCWAACAEMCGKSITPTSTRTQHDVVKYTHGSEDNISGDPIDIALGCEYVAMDKRSFTLDLPSWGKLNEKTGKKETVVAAGLSVDDPNSGHVFLVNGTTFIDGYGDTQHKVTYIDPAFAQEYTFYYDEFVSGEATGFEIGVLVLTE